MPGEEETEELVLETEDDEQAEEEFRRAGMPEGDEDQDADASDDEDADEVAFADEAEEEVEETPLVKRLRSQLRERTKEVNQLRRPAAPAVIEVGEKPTLEGCDYDPDRFEEELESWKDRKAKAEAAETTASAEAEKAQKEWHTKIAAYERGKADLRVPGKAEAEAEALASLSQHQQAVIVKYAENPAALIIALGKSPKKLETLSAMNDLGQFTFTVAKLEKELKVGKKKAPEPEGIVRGAAPLSNVGDKRLEKLEREAARTGDRSEVIRYKADLKKKAA